MNAVYDDLEQLQAIVNRPMDTAPRLIYADWLEERGECARAEFIRIQCELAFQCRPYTGRLAALDQRQEQLLADHCADWLGEVRGCLRDFSFERGFVDWVCMTPTQFRAGADRVFRRCPVRSLTLQGERPSEGLFGRWLRLAEAPAPPLGDLFESPLLKQLNRLCLDVASVSDADADALARCRYVRKVYTLHVRYNALSDVGRQLLARRFGNSLRIGLLP
ncbi:MAG: TIGR02996 domain-containing protein [Planctomycetia bacterium]|nr:TIGR02996 domain-containing protein [Planctomycetia bacterium]